MMKTLPKIFIALALLIPLKSDALFFPGNASTTIAVDLAKEPVSQVTFMAWVYSTSTTATQAIGGRASSTSIAGPYFMRIQSGTGLRWGIRTTGTDQQLNTTAGSWATNRWGHMAGVYDGTNMIVYINGTFSTSTAKTGPGNLMGGGVETHPLTIGRYMIPSTLPCQGCQIADVRVYNRALSATEIKNYFYTGFASRTGLAYHLPLWTTSIVNLADNTRMGSTTGGTLIRSRLPNFAKYKK